MSLFGQAPDASKVKAETDVSKRTVDTGIYPGKIDIAFAGKSSGGASSVTVHVSLDNGKKVAETVYVTNKEGLATYVDKNTGDLQYLPGYNTINNLCIMCTGKGLHDLAESVETRTVKLYDFDAKKDLPTDVQAITKLADCRVLLAIQEEEYAKKKKGADGAYYETGEVGVINTISKVFHPETRQTPVEIREGKDAAYADFWEGKNKGVLKTVKVTAAPANQNTAPTPSGLF